MTDIYQQVDDEPVLVTQEVLDGFRITAPSQIPRSRISAELLNRN